MDPLNQHMTIFTLMTDLEEPLVYTSTNTALTCNFIDFFHRFKLFFGFVQGIAVQTECCCLGRC